MSGAGVLPSLLDAAAQADPEAVAFRLYRRESITYGELRDAAERVAEALGRAGIGRGDRVGVCLPKSVEAITAIFGILRAGAAYVPIGSDTPPARTAFVFDDCSVRAAVVDSAIADDVVAALEEECAPGPAPPVVPVDAPGDGTSLRASLARLGTDETTAEREIGPDDVAYILYTSGSTGKPKGVTISHRAAMSFIEWSSEAFEPRPDDRFSSHAPFHFDLSILDIYLPVRHGATSVPIPEDVAKDPLRLGELIEEERLTFWYSTPSVLGMMVRFGRVGDRDLSSLRTVLFAGEVMPMQHLRAWKELVPDADFHNLYGPTETNVCTAYAIPRTIPEDRTSPYPIGKACSHYRIRVVDGSLSDVEPGEEGELVAAGPGVMSGYWERPDLDAAVFFEDGEGTRWYRTGDIVAEDEGGDYVFLGRRDRMVKRRGFRVELDEIEVALHAHERVADAAVISREHPVDGVQIFAFVTLGDDDPLSTIAFKKYCTDVLPYYMVPDRFIARDDLPRTRTNKIDYVRLADEAG